MMIRFNLSLLLTSFICIANAHSDFAFEKQVKWAILAELGSQRSIQILARDTSGNYLVWSEAKGAVTYQNRCGIEVSYNSQASFAYPFLVSASKICRVNESEKAWVKVQDIPNAENPFSIAYVGSYSSTLTHEPSQATPSSSDRPVQPKSALTVQAPTMVFLYNWAPFPDENDEGGSLNAIAIPLNASAKNPSARVKTILNRIPGYSGAIRLNRTEKKVGITLSDGNSLNELISLDSNQVFQLSRNNGIALDWKSQKAQAIRFKGLSLSLDFTDFGFVVGQENEKVLFDTSGKRNGSVVSACTWLGVVGDEIYELCDGKKIVRSSLQHRLGRPAPGGLL